MCNKCTSLCACHRSKPHKHAEVIKAWADGAIIQINCGTKSEPDWVDIRDENPCFYSIAQYRVKPEPKPDIVRYAKAAYTEYHPSSPPSWKDNRDITSTYWSSIQASTDNIKATWDGETGKLKSVEII